MTKDQYYLQFLVVNIPFSKNINIFRIIFQDIDRALENNYPHKLKPKLVMRQENAKRMRINQTSVSYHQSVPCISENSKNSAIESATDAVMIKYQKNLGRHIVATKGIGIGEIIAIERPYCAVLIDDYCTHCHACLQVCLNMLPCSTCTQALFCSQSCLEEAQKYHRYECKILKTLRELNIDKMKFIALRLAFITKVAFLKMNSVVDLGSQKYYYSSRYEEIHNLVSNTSLRSVADLFKRASASAVLYHLVKEYSLFFENENDENMFKEILLLHMQTAPCNFHEISEICNTKDIFIPKEIGAGAYAFLSMFNHSCNPNVVRQCYGTTIVLRAIRTIEEGQQCFDNYGYVCSMKYLT